MPEPIKSYWQVLEPIFSAIDLLNEAEFLSSTAKMQRSVVILYAAHFCLSEIHNGGLLQFFWNTTGIVAPEAIEGFNAIGMQGLASILEAATDALGSPFPRDRDDRWDALLVASGRTEEELERIFGEASNFYLAFEEATASLSFATLNEKIWSLAKSENGGFQVAATRYARDFCLHPEAPVS